MNRDTDPQGFVDPDTEIDAVEVMADEADEVVAGTIDGPTDRHEIAAIHDPHPLDTHDDRKNRVNANVISASSSNKASNSPKGVKPGGVSKESWPAATTLPFTRGKHREAPIAPVRIHSDTPATTAERPVVGHRYLNYEIRRRLARGSMGLVYEASHLHLKRRVAIKFLSPALLSDENIVYRFLGEAQAMARIDHPGIPTVFDFGQDNAGNAYLIMDYLEGESLAAKLERGPLPYNTVIEVAAQVAEILAAAHAANIVHRDLKPENILLCDEEQQTPDGPRPIVRLIDFGICKSRSVDERAETAAGNLIGTPRYMAPEQTYSKEITPRTDVYALGCVIFELVCGRAPFDGRLAELVDAHRHNIPLDIRSYCPSAAPRLAELVDQMLAKEPGARPNSGAELANELRGCAHPAASPRDSSRRRTTLPTPRATTALSAIEDGVLSAERTPLPFHPVTPTWSDSRTDHAPARAFGSMSVGGTTEITIPTVRLSWVVIALMLVTLAGLGLMVLSGALPL